MANFLTKFIERLTAGGAGADTKGVKSDRNAIWVYVRCQRCGEAIAIRLSKSSEIQRNFSNDRDAAFFVRKVVVGNKCFNRMNLELTFDARYRVTDKQLGGGEFITQTEYKADASV